MPGVVTVWSAGLDLARTSILHLIGIVNSVRCTGFHWYRTTTVLVPALFEFSCLSPECVCVWSVLAGRCLVGLRGDGRALYIHTPNSQIQPLLTCSCSSSRPAQARETKPILAASRSDSVKLSHGSFLLRFSRSRSIYNDSLLLDCCMGGKITLS